jgi:hypothetical protein
MARLLMLLLRLICIFFTTYTMCTLILLLPVLFFLFMMKYGFNLFIFVRVVVVRYAVKLHTWPSIVQTKRDRILYPPPEMMVS